MKISIFGMGYVGCVSGACLAKLGHKVIGVDTNPLKVAMINEGKSPVVEQEIDSLMAETTQSSAYSAIGDVKTAIEQTDMALICVGTPSRSNGSIDRRYIARVSEQIGSVLKDRQGYYLIVVRSTVLPGSVEDIVIPALEQNSGKKAGVDFGVCMNPEYLREGTAVSDFFNPPKTVIGQLDTRSGDMLQCMYEKINAPIIRTTIKTAEMSKYVDNCFHALKITFANEIGNICKELSIDSHEVMNIFCQDRKLNISATYLKPGFAFGGSCLPKDLRALSYESKILDIDTPLLSSILVSNKQQILRTASKILEYKGKTIGFMGLSFKGGTDDLRESPLVEVIETLIGKGVKVLIYDKNVSLAKLMGANKEYIEKELPHISSLMCKSTDELLQKSDVVIIGNKEEEFKDVFLKIRKNQVVIDLVRICQSADSCNGSYDGICW